MDRIVLLTVFLGILFPTAKRSAPYTSTPACFAQISKLFPVTCSGNCMYRSGAVSSIGITNPSNILFTIMFRSIIPFLRSATISSAAPSSIKAADTFASSGEIEIFMEYSAVTSLLILCYTMLQDIFSLVINVAFSRGCGFHDGKI